MKINRRGFLFGSAAAVALAGHATQKTGRRALKPGEKLNVAMIGVGIQGRGNLDSFLGNKRVAVVAVCDADRVRLAD
ncbi:MAG TPA: gfo/Idh/MocA family oxidoreductase, partial [Verrucomicrobia bacterium]|nr:gfo/Idh/MocA family oxidoreductase [Verrucomicrobiota bacterium]